MYVQGNLYNKGTTGNAVGCPVYGGVPILDGLIVYMSMQGISNGAEQSCLVKGGGFMLEVSFNRGFTVFSLKE